MVIAARLQLAGDSADIPVLLPERRGQHSPLDLRGTIIERHAGQKHLLGDLINQTRLFTSFIARILHRIFLSLKPRKKLALDAGSPFSLVAEWGAVERDQALWIASRNQFAPDEILRDLLSVRILKPRGCRQVSASSIRAQEWYNFQRVWKRGGGPRTG
jgi:hypothetical protein